MILGWFTAVRSRRGRGGIRIPGSGMEAHISRSESASESATSEVTAGAGVIGGPIGITESLFMITIGTTLGAIRFITTTTTIEAETRAADLAAAGAEMVSAAMKGTGPPMRTPAAPTGLKTVPARRPGLPNETITLLEGTLNPIHKPLRARALSAAHATAAR